ncbi:arginase-1-like [Tigriopus californicus]|uniref:arginase-1-like n=1 Tax=Tigriopus californicus TaxID=6832 RepID=UPI0027DA56DE|nr:arginase-1-like [Tigriopus californicus]
MAFLLSKLKVHKGTQPFKSLISVAHRSKSNIVIGQIDDGVHSWKQIRIGIVGAPFHLGQPHQGVEKAPVYIRKTGVAEKLKELGHDVYDFGDLDHDVVEEAMTTYGDFPINNMEYNKRLSERVKSILQENRFCLTIGGDHSIGFGTVYGHLQAHPDACVLWVDAHADINTPNISDSGHWHGMPLSFQLREMASALPKLPNTEWFQPLLDTQRMAYIGLRDVDPLERTIMDRLNVPSYSMREIDQFGVRDCLKQALAKINPNGDRPLHVSFDIDSLDPSEAPSTGTPVRGGLSLREGMTILEDCFETGTMRALDLVEVNVHLGNYEEGTRTLDAAKSLILAAMGNYRGGRTPLPAILKDLEHKLPPKPVQK